MKRFVLVLLVSFLAGCSANRKLQAASILRQCKAELVGLNVRSFEIDPALFPSMRGNATEALPNANVLPLVQKLFNGELEKPLGHVKLEMTLRVHNQSKDSLWIDSLNGAIFLDSLLQSPLSLSHPVLLIPGSSDISLLAIIPIDQSLFKLGSVQKYRIQGAARAALAQDGERVMLEFDESRTLPPEQMENLLSTAKQALIEQVLTNWAGSLL